MSGYRKQGRATTRRRAARVLALLLGLVVLATLVPSGAAAKDGQVTVRAAGTTNASVTIKLSDLGGNDINNRTYQLKEGPVTISGYSLSKVMKAAAAESEAIEYGTIPSIEIDKPTGRPVRISGAEMRNPLAFRDGPPVFYEDNGATVFVMPGRGNDTGSRFRFNFAPVGISIQSGLDYEVDLTASPSKIKAGGTVRFRATVTGQESGVPLSYRWSFGDGQSKTTSSATIRHRYRTDGSFSVVIEVTGAGGSGQDGLLIEVGKVKPDKPEKPDRKPDKPDKKPSGNDGTGGDGNPPGDGGYGSGTGDHGYNYGAGIPPSPGSGTPAPPDPQTPDPKPRPVPEPDDGLTAVTGELLNPAAAPVPVDPSAGPAVESADPAPSGASQGGFGAHGAAFTLAGVGLLLGLGGFAELRIFSRLY